MRKFPIRSIVVIVFAVLFLAAGCTQLATGSIQQTWNGLPIISGTMAGGDISTQLLGSAPVQITLNFSTDELSDEKEGEAAEVTLAAPEISEGESKGNSSTQSQSANSGADAQQSTSSAQAPAATLKANGPVAFVWGGSRQYTFRVEVRVENRGSSTASTVWVDVPMLENTSPYQTTALKSTNYEIAYTTGRVASFGIGDIKPGESKTITAEYNISLRHVAISSTNDTVEKARQAYEQYAGSGNCLTLATGFVNKARDLGVTARVVNGFARAQRSNMTAGSLEGSRHSWAEFYVDGLGWVPVDLTFQYFGALPHTSHIVETYSDLSVKAYHLGGDLKITWLNSVF